MKPLVYLMTALFLVATAEARKVSASTREKAKEEAAQKKKEKEKRDKKRLAIDRFLAAKDTNHDGSLTLDEFTAGESDVAAATKKFVEFNKNGDRYLSKEEIGEMLKR